MVSHDCVAFYLLREEVSKSVKVVQSGQGADEILAGYDWYPPLANVAREHDHRGLREGVLRPRPRRRAGDLRPGIRDCRRRPEPRVRRWRTSPRRAPRPPWTPRCGWTPQVMLVDDPVKRVDNMTMAWGLEARVPFLDHDFVELAATCPADLKLAYGGKGVLKERRGRCCRPR